MINIIFISATLLLSSCDFKNSTKPSIHANKFANEFDLKAKYKEIENEDYSKEHIDNEGSFKVVKDKKTNHILVSLFTLAKDIVYFFKVKEYENFKDTMTQGGVFTCLVFSPDKLKYEEKEAKVKVENDFIFLNFSNILLKISLNEFKDKI